jgi:hypothetical protein
VPGPTKIIILNSIQSKRYLPRAKIFEEKYRKVGLEMVNNFCYWSVVSNSTDFELKFRFLPKFESQRARYIGTLYSLM